MSTDVSVDTSFLNTDLAALYETFVINLMIECHLKGGRLNLRAAS